MCFNCVQPMWNWILIYYCVRGGQGVVNGCCRVLCEGWTGFSHRLLQGSVLFTCSVPLSDACCLAVVDGGVVTAVSVVTVVSVAEQRDDDGGASKKPRVVWSVEMHQQFVQAVNQLGIDSKSPGGWALRVVPGRVTDACH
jgi:hypothetical protein